MDYPTGFPEHLKRSVDTVIANAEADFVDARQQLRALHFSKELENIGIDFIETVIFGFGEQVCEAVKQGHVNGEMARSQMEVFLHAVVVKTYFEKCRTRDGSPDGSSRFIDEAKLHIKGCKKWAKYQRALADALGKSAQGGKVKRVGYRRHILAWMKRQQVQDRDQAARRLGISMSTLKSIMSDKGRARYGDETLQRVLKTIGYSDNDRIGD